ncbi:heterokaryon incompatibility protein-domain-containing protein, partial [Stachybotrys elegans]
MPLYEPISATEFRIVHILPGSFDDDIHCVLETRPSEVKTQYEALSYQWGEPSPAKPTIRISPFRDASFMNKPSRSARMLSRLRNTRANIPPSVSRFYRRARNVMASHITVKIYFLFFYGVLFGVFPHWMAVMVGFLISPYILVVVCDKSVDLIDEILETQPWLLATWFLNKTWRIPAEETLDCEVLSVMPNLALALRYLRGKDQPRAFWIDAICINQLDEAEKKVQVNRMDFIYANASTLLIWLGDYHGIGDSPPCSDVLRIRCEHKRQIAKAFEYMSTKSSMNLFKAIKSHFESRTNKERLRKAMPGLISIARRGYWERLWVVQETALATGPIKIQCGHHVCDFQGIHAAQHHASLDKHEMKVIAEEAFRSTRRFVLAFKDFRYSSLHDHGMTVATSRYVYKVTTVAMSFIWADLEDELRQFHDHPYAHRLQLIMLRTSGYFQCRDEQDRLYAVLGVVGGTKKGKRAIANTTQLFSSQFLYTAIGIYIDMWLKKKLGDIRTSFFIRSTLGLVVGSWSVFFEEKAKFWTLNRPQYVMSTPDEATRALAATSTGPDKNVSGFFRGLAQFLANETGTLAFLDAAPCGANAMEDLPSWAPYWQTRIGDGPYEFAKSVKGQMASDSFRFLQDGSVLELLGYEHGRITEARAIDPAVANSSTWQFVSDKMFAVPMRLGEIVAFHLKCLGDISLEETLHPPVVALFEEMVKVSIQGGQMILKQYGSNVFHYVKDDLPGSLGFVKAGDARKGDSFIHVPGCYHQLVLRPVTVPGRPVRWKLAGLAVTIEIA